MDKFSENMLNIYGVDGKAWLDLLPQIIDKLSVYWNLHSLKVHKNISYNYVLEGYKDNCPIILKIGFDKTIIRAEHAALSAFQDYGIIKLLADELDIGALLLERAIPGKTLNNSFPNEDAKAMKIVCTLIDHLHKAPYSNNNTFPQLATWLEIIENDWDFPQHHLQRARELKSYLLDSTRHAVLLHGDLHHDNILSNGDSWVIIDPRGVIGDATYDKTGCLFREPLSKLLKMPDIISILNNRINLVSQHFNIEAKRIVQWSYLQTIMAICGCLKENQSPIDMLEFLAVVTTILEF